MDTIETAEAFLLHCEKERHLSTNTLAAYRQDLAEFTGRLGSAEIAAVSGRDLVDFAAWLSGPRGLAPATVKRRLACLRSMFAWLVRKSAVPANPFASVEIRVRIPDRLPRCLPSADMARLAKAAQKAPDRIGLAVLLLFSTGARVSELAAVRVSDVDVGQGTIRLFGKGDRERLVFVPNALVSGLLEARVAARTKAGKPEENLLTAADGRPMSAASIRRGVRRLSREAGLPRPVTPAYAEAHRGDVALGSGRGHAVRPAAASATGVSRRPNSTLT